MRSSLLRGLALPLALGLGAALSGCSGGTDVQLADVPPAEAAPGVQEDLPKEGEEVKTPPRSNMTTNPLSP